MGSDPCSLMIVGTAPGESEEASGVPFEGKTGQMLREIVAGFGLDERVYYTNVIPRRPTDSKGKNRKPTVKEIYCCSGHLANEIRKLKPGLILAVGATPFEFLTGLKVPLSTAHGLTVKVDKFGMYLSVVPIFCPSFVTRRGGLLSNVGSDWIADLESIRDQLEIDD